MSSKRQIRRNNFRNSVFKRDGFCCMQCSLIADPLNAEAELDAHHITDRNNMPFGGYVEDNGITLCKDCHLKAEQYFAYPKKGWSPEELYALIGSTYEKALQAAKQSKVGG